MSEEIRSALDAAMSKEQSGGVDPDVAAAIAAVESGESRPPTKRSRYGDGDDGGAWISPSYAANHAAKAPEIPATGGGNPGEAGREDRAAAEAQARKSGYRQASAEAAEHQRSERAGTWW